MKIRYAEFAACAVGKDQWPKDGLPEVALAGRSNVGKSSLINRLINRKGLAKTSSTPGKTRTVNFYKLNKKFYLVDLPGFGYAKAPRGERKSWGRMVEGYIEGRSPLKAVIIILDIRRDPGEHEIKLLDWLESMDIPTLAVLTKADKFSKSKRMARAQAIKKELSLDSPILFSSLTGEGKEELAKRLNSLISGKETR